MLTVRQVEKYWQIRAFDRLIDELCAGRGEAVGGIRQLLRGPVVAAGLAVVRLTELNQGQVPLVAQFIRFLINQQQLDGGWMDPVTTAVAVRALCSDGGSGTAMARGFEYLKMLQRDDGTWPREGMRRMPGDPATTAFILHQLIACASPIATALIDQTLDRLTGPDTPIGDEQLAPMRRRLQVTSRQREFASLS